jgi:hypothetical protein
MQVKKYEKIVCCFMATAFFSFEIISAGGLPTTKKYSRNELLALRASPHAQRLSQPLPRIDGVVRSDGDVYCIEEMPPIEKVYQDQLLQLENLRQEISHKTCLDRCKFAVVALNVLTEKFKNKTVAQKEKKHMLRLAENVGKGLCDLRSYDERFRKVWGPIENKFDFIMHQLFDSLERDGDDGEVPTSNHYASLCEEEAK